jgi:hypothetical protein
MQRLLVVYHRIENYSVSFSQVNINDNIFFLTVPDRCTDDVVGLEHFSRVFHKRYGSTGPILYIGSLEQAIQDSLNAPAKEVTIIIL